jgi:uncharacterized protein YqhQ
MGITVTVGAALGILSFFISTLAGLNPISLQQLFDMTNNNGTTSSIVVGVYSMMLLIGSITIATFYSSKAHVSIFEAQNQNGIKLLMNIVGYF